MAVYQQAGNRSFVADVIVLATNVDPRARAFEYLLNQCSHPMSKNRQVVGHDKIHRSSECGDRSFAASKMAFEIVASAKHLQVSLRLPVEAGWMGYLVDGSRSEIGCRDVGVMGVRGKRAKSQVGD